jgi:hypothetical protein
VHQVGFSLHGYIEMHGQKNIKCMPSTEAGHFFISGMLHPMSQVTQTAGNSILSQVYCITLASLGSWLLFVAVLS